MVQPSVEELIRGYIEARGEGAEESIEEFAARHPAHAEDLRKRLRKLELAGLLTAPDEPVVIEDLPSSFDGYQVLGELGRGGMGVVFEARDEELDRVVAIKVMNGAARFFGTYQERFEREIATLASIRHPNIVSVFRSGVVDELPYVVMDRIEGESLSSELPTAPVRHTREMIERSLRLGIRLARALDHIHERGVVHRDVKPTNVIVDSTGEPILIDFGLARGADTDSLTLTGEFVGTLAYTAPEQALGERVDARADVYGLGATLYHLFTGSPPYRARSITDLVRQIQSGPATSAGRVNRSLGSDLVTVLDCATALDPQGRYATCEDLARDLEALIEGRPITARRIGAGGRLVRWAKRRPGAAVASALTPISVVLLIVLGSVFWGRHVEAREQLFQDLLEKAFYGAIRGYVPDVTYQESLSQYQDLCERSPADLDAWNLLMIQAVGRPSQGVIMSPRPDVERVRLARVTYEGTPEAYKQEPAGLLIGRVIEAVLQGDPIPGEEGAVPGLPRPTGVGERCRLALAYSRVSMNPGLAIEILEPALIDAPADYAVHRLRASLEMMDADPAGFRSAAVARALDEGSPRAAMAYAKRLFTLSSELERYREPSVAEALTVGREAASAASDDYDLLADWAWLLAEAKPPGWAEESKEVLERVVANCASPLARFNLVNRVLDGPRGIDGAKRVIELYTPIQDVYGSRFYFLRNFAWAVSLVEGVEPATELLEGAVERVDAEARWELLGLLAEYQADPESGRELKEAELTWHEAFSLAPNTAESTRFLIGPNFVGGVESCREAILDRAMEQYRAGVVLDADVIRVLRAVGRLEAESN